jgi:DNA-binding PadR family transcriptional regulator
MINATAASLLGYLEMGPMTGWELVAQIEQTIGNFWNVTRSQVYRELNSLAAAGLVEAGDPGPRARQPFHITDSGRRAFTDWINREPGPELIREPLLLTVFFRDRVEPEKLQRYLTTHRLRHEAQLERYEQLEAALSGVTGGPLDTLRLGIAYERAVLDWIDGLQNDDRDVRASAAGSSGRR